MTGANPFSTMTPRPAASRAEIRTPCIKVCVIEPMSSLCLGCGRSLREIGAWSGLSPQMRDAVMAELPARLEHLRATVPDAFPDVPEAN